MLTVRNLNFTPSRLRFSAQRRTMRALLLGCAAVLQLASLLQAQSAPQFTVTDIGILPGYALSQATAISSNGTVVGYSGSAGFSLTTALPTPGTGTARGWIYANSVLT